MPSRDFLTGDAFSARTLTGLINMVPPLKLPVGGLGLFQGLGIATDHIAVWERHGSLSILTEKTPNAPADEARPPSDTVRGFTLYRFKVKDTVRASDMRNRISVGSDADIEAAWQDEVDRRLRALRQMHELTLEWHRFNALRGYVVSGDGSTTLKDLYTEFGVSGGRPAPTDCALGTADNTLVTAVETAKQAIRDALGFEPPQYYGFQSPKYLRSFRQHAKVREFWRVAEAANLGADLTQTGFNWMGVKWFQHDSKQGKGSLWCSEGASVEGVDMTHGHAMIFAGGIDSLYLTRYGPGPTINDIGKPGEPISVTTEVLPHNEGIELKTESNIICLCTRPAALRTLYSSN